MPALIGLLAEPLLRELIVMGPAVTGAVAHEEVVLDVADHPMLEHRAFLIVDQHVRGYAAEPLEAADQPFVGMLRILAIGAAEVNAPRIPNRVRTEWTVVSTPPIRVWA